jgi:hypothetical protein
MLLPVPAGAAVVVAPPAVVVAPPAVVVVAPAVVDVAPDAAVVADDDGLSLPHAATSRLPAVAMTKSERFMWSSPDDRRSGCVRVDPTLAIRSA